MIRKILAIYLLFSAIVSAVYYATHYSSGVDELLWYCNVALILSSIAFFRKNSFLAGAVLITAIPTQFFWILGDIRYLFFGEVMGRYAWLREEAGKWGLLFDLNYHAAVIPCVFYAVWKWGYSRRTVWGAWGILLGLMFGSRFLTRPESNVNCAFFPCDLAGNPAALESFGWPYALARCGIFLLMSGLIHLGLMLFLPKKRLIP